MEAQTHLENLAIRALNQFISHASIVGRFVIHFGKSSSAIASGAPPTAPIGARISEGDNRLGIENALTLGRKSTLTHHRSRDAIERRVMDGETLRSIRCAKSGNRDVDPR